jgi:hypothetical protein
VGSTAGAAIGRLNFLGPIPSAMEARLLRRAHPAFRIAYGNLVLEKAPGIFLREMFCTYKARLERFAYPNSEATLLPSPSIPPRPAVDDPVEARWRTPSNSDGTPIALPKRLVSTP